MIAGNKADLNQSKVISDEQAQTYAKSVGSTYFPTSAKAGHNVEEIFLALARSKTWSCIYIFRDSRESAAGFSFRGSAN
jgi:hypothetical protein